MSIFGRLDKWLERHQTVKRSELMLYDGQAAALAKSLREDIAKRSLMETQLSVLAVNAGELEKLKERVGKLELAMGFNRAKRIG